MNELFDCPVPVEYQDLTGTGTVGHYDPKKDLIVLCTSLQHEFPYQRNIVKLHEIFHATGGHTRSLRMGRLDRHFGRKKYRVEECIAEICTMVAMKKLGILTPYSSTIPMKGIKQNYDGDIYIPWKEVVSALYMFTSKESDFSHELNIVKQYLKNTINMDIREHYEG